MVFAFQKGGALPAADRSAPPWERKYVNCALGVPWTSSGGRIIARYDRRECGPVDGEIADSHAYAPEEERAAQSWRGFFF